MRYFINIFICFNCFRGSKSLFISQFFVKYFSKNIQLITIYVFTNLNLMYESQNPLIHSLTHSLIINLRNHWTDCNDTDVLRGSCSQRSLRNSIDKFNQVLCSDTPNTFSKCFTCIINKTTVFLCNSHGFTIQLLPFQYMGVGDVGGGGGRDDRGVGTPSAQWGLP